jgi:hypothetical protein
MLSQIEKILIRWGPEIIVKQIKKDKASNNTNPKEAFICFKQKYIENRTNKS